MPVAAQQAERLNVVTLVDRPRTAGGGERLAMEVAKRLDQDRFQPILCASRWPAERASDQERAVLDELRDAGVRFLGLERRSAAALWSWRPLVSLVRGEPVHVLHAHKFGSNAWAAILRPLARPPVVIAHEHTWSYEGNPLRRLTDRYLIAPRVDAVVAVSRADRERMITVEGISPAKIRFIPNGIPSLPREPGDDIRAELGIDPRDPVIGAVSSLRAQKGYDVLLRTAAILRSRFPRLRVLIAGEGEERAHLEALTAELGLDRTVMLLGYRPDVPDLLRTLDVAVSSSNFEGSPLSIMEYMEAGKPVVGTSVGGVPDLIEHGVNGLLVEPRNPGLLASSIGELLRDPERAVEMGARGRERRRSEFDITVTVRRLEALYEELWAGARSRRRLAE
jgi:glycosyltransferase involved in cell wall biosynthesis